MRMRAGDRSRSFDGSSDGSPRIRIGIFPEEVFADRPDRDATAGGLFSRPYTEVG